MSIKAMEYRADVDGLRAIAVLAVVIFHLNSAALPGGFIGVDIFFVISGYLITSIIYREILADSFSFRNFYIRRIKRILPIFYVVLFATLLVGFFLLPPAEYTSLSKSAIASNSFLANVRFAFSGSYFQEDNMRPLLHIWSLSLEEQFYFFWPLALIIGARLRPKLMFAFVLMTILLSFGLALVVSSTEKYSTMSYYLIPTRVGELLLGALVALFLSRCQKNISSNWFSFLGAIMVVTSLIFIDDKDIFPGFYSFLPCFGTALIIIGGNDALVNRFLALKPLVFIGLLSYSLYLWHWPIITYYKYYNFVSTLTLFESLGIMLSSIALSFVSMKYVEQVFRRLRCSKRATLLWYFVVPFIFVYVLAFFILKEDGLPKRFDLTREMSVIETVGCHNNTNNDKCYISGTGVADILLIGDSHAGHYANFFKRIGEQLQLNIIDASSAGCQFYQDIFISRQCESTKEKISKNFNEVKTVIVTIRLENLLERQDLIDYYIDYIINRLAKAEKTVIVLGQLPRNSNERFLEQYIRTKQGRSLPRMDGKTDNNVNLANELVRVKLKHIKGVKYFEFNSVFCPMNACKMFDDKNNPLYFDDDHISAFGAEWLAEQVLNSEQFEPFLKTLKE